MGQARPSPRGERALWPQTLTAGLANQMYTLVGYVLMAHRVRLPLVLPTLCSHVQYPRCESGVPFGDLFNASAFAAALRESGVDTLVSFVDGGAWRPDGMSGWEEYRAFSLERRRRQGHPLQPLEDAVLRALRPSDELARRVATTATGLSLGDAYGCVHARIEEDMLASMHAGRPPTLGQYLSGVAAVPQLLGERSIFVAVGLAISTSDAAMIDSATTVWGARLVRSRWQKAWHRGRLNGSEPSYVAASASDFELCRRASWFVGWCGSTFATALAHVRKLDRGDGWYAACDTGLRHVPPANEVGLGYACATGASCEHRPRATLARAAVTAAADVSHATRERSRAREATRTMMRVPTSSSVRRYDGGV